MKRIAIVIFAVFLLVIACLLVENSFSEANKVFQIIAYAGAFIVGVVALSTYWENSSIKRMEFIDQVYRQFDEDEEMGNLYDLLMEDKNLKIPLKSSNEPALIKALTLFDRVLNYYEQNLINKKALSYIAAEILDFYNHPGVNEYIKDIRIFYEYDKKGYEEDIRFYALKQLGDICSEKFLMKEAKRKWMKSRKVIQSD